MTRTGNKIMDDITDAYSEASKTNAEFYKQSFDLLKEASNIPMDLPRIIMEGSSTLSKGFVNYMRLYAEHTSKVLDLGRSVSKELLASMEKGAPQSKPSGQQQDYPGVSVSELRLSGSAGDLCRSYFILESKKPEPVQTTFSYSRFFHELNNDPISIPLIFNPAEVTVSPGEKVQISIEAGIPIDAPAGTFRSMVWIEGFPENCLKVLVDVKDKIVKKSKQKK